MAQPSYHHSHRDPGGVNPSGVELSVGEDPVGVAESSPANGGSAAVPPPTPTRKHPATTPVMALLVGTPPPPPPTPPPPKKRSSSRKKSRSAATVPTVRSVDDTLSATTATTTLPSTKTGMTLVEQRRQAALAIYESDRLVLDPPEDGTVEDDRLSHSTKGLSVSKDQENSSPRKAGTKQAPPSPMSAVTEPHTNLNPLAQRVESTNGAPEEAVSSTAPTPKAKKQQPKTPENKSKSTEVESSPDNKSKRGFFRNFFGGKKGKDKSFDDSTEAKSENSEAVSKKSRGKKSLRGKSSSSKDYSNPNTSIGDESGSLNDVDRDRPEVFFAHDEISTLTSPTFESNNTRRKDPLQRVESDRTSDPMGQYWDNYNGSEETDSKEQDGTPTIDPFTEPFFREPDGASPMAKTLSPKKADLRISVPHVNDPVGDSPHNDGPSTRTNHAISGRTIQDPSPRGSQVPLEHQYMDPAGESPLHKNQRGPTALRDGSPYAADPPLYTGAGISSDVSTEEEKKDDDNIESRAFNKDSPPPPPPPPRERLPLSPHSFRSNKTQSGSPTTGSVASKETIDKSQYHKTQSSPTGSATSAKSLSPSASPYGEESVSEIDEPTAEEEHNEKGSKSKKSLTVSSAARMNAKAVAYIHTLNGEPSPRHAWKQAEFSDDEASPAHHAFKTTALNQTVTTAEALQMFHAAEDGDSKLFSAYSGKFKGRHKKNGMASPVEPDVFISNDSVVMGIAILRKQREEDIASGKATRVVLEKKQKAPVVQSYFGALDAPEPKDPIQRAGRRLLAKAAIPIQANARRFLAQRKAVDRMWALIEIQSYFRRFKAEASLLSHRHSAVKIQISFRKVRSRCAATQIQKIVRAYLAAARTYDMVYSIILIQAKSRGMLVRKDLSRQANSAIAIQSTYRGFMAKSVDTKRYRSITKMQALWRAYYAQMRFRFTVVDVVIVQNVARRWIARRLLTVMREERLQNAAAKIQAMWRGFQGYTDYIFALVDVLVVQRTVRQWLAKQKSKHVRLDTAAVKIQTNWRRFNAQMQMLYDLVHIIMVQSVVRRKLAQPRIKERQDERNHTFGAAAKIQAAWRGFWGFSHFVIMQYEISRLQAISRGNTVRKDFRMRLGCCIMIQSVARRYLANKQMKVLRKSGVLVNAAAKSMRETRACEQIQFWWRVVLDCRTEKQAALVIERFFLSVKAEVDREIRRVEKKKSSKSKQYRRKRKEADDKLLERVWLNTVDENHVDVFVYSPTDSMASKSPNSGCSSYSASSPKRSPKRIAEKAGWRHHASSPTMNLVMRHEQDTPTDSLALSASGDASELSGLSFQNTPASRSKLSHPELTEDLSLEEAYLDAEVRRGKEKKRSNEKYLKMYGIQTAPNRSSRTSAFFSEGLTTPSVASSKKTRKSLSSILSSRSSTGSSPRTPVEPPGHRGERSTLKAVTARRSKVPVKIVPEYEGEEFGLI